MFLKRIHKVKLIKSVNDIMLGKGIGCTLSYKINDPNYLENQAKIQLMTFSNLLFRLFNSVLQNKSFKEN